MGEEQVAKEGVEPVEDMVLVERARAGETEAFGELVDRYQEKIYRLTYHMTGNREEAEDLAQEALVRAYKALHRFKGKSSFYTWLYKIAVNRSLNHLKKRKRKRLYSLDDVDLAIERDEVFLEISARESPFRGAAINELQEKLNTALMTLSEKHRLVVVLHDIEGVPHDQIAKTLGCSSGTVRSRLHYARRQLQTQLSEYA